MLLALPVQLREAVLGDPPPGWVDSSLSPRGSGDFLAMASAGIVLFSDGYMEGGIACCFCGLFFVSSVLYP